jgi:type I restriction-modification system DNA methylase subunit
MTQTAYLRNKSTHLGAFIFGVNDLVSAFIATNKQKLRNQGLNDTISYMSDEQKRILERQLWAVANTLRGRMNADEYKVYILGFIFYKYLSEKLELYVNEKLLARESFTYTNINPDSKDGKEQLATIKDLTLEHLGF